MHLTLSFVGGCISFFLVSSCLIAAPDQYYRSIHSGGWNDISVWECSSDPMFIGVQPASEIPDYYDRTILISEEDTIVITSSVVIDEVIVEPNAMLIYGNYPGSVMTISDGPGIDLLINGTFEDSGPVNLVWATGLSSWALGDSATMIRTKSTSATLWRDHYENGMSTIPSSSTWILRKLYVDPPSISGINSWYGNLKIENMTAVFWNANLVGSKITGSSSAPVIKGNMEVGVSGVSGVKFYSQNSAANRLKILGNLIIGVGSEFRLEDATTTSGASGIELSGSLVVDGILSYDPNEASDQNRELLFTGQMNQYLMGSGSVLLYNFSIAKPHGEVILSRNIEVNNRLVLEEGKLDLNGHTLTIQNSEVTAIERIDGWIKSERSDFASVLAWNIGTVLGVHEFPFGKMNEYIPVFISVESGDVGVVSIATYYTTSHNQPLPPLVTNLLFQGVESSVSMVDRFWYMHKTGNSGVVRSTFTYAPDERQGNEDELEAIEYDEHHNHWMVPLCCQTNSFVQRKVSVPGVSNNAVWTLIIPDEALSFYEEEEFSSQDIIVEPTIRLFPIPCEEEITLDYGMSLERPVFFEMVNLLGELVYKGNITDEGTTLYRISLSGINRKGIYYLQVTDSFSMKTFKLILK